MTTSGARELVGKVVSDKMEKTIVVMVERSVRHPKYGKIIRKRKKFHAHDEQGTAREGDTVRIRETSPISKLKTWKLVDVMKDVVESAV